MSKENLMYATVVLWLPTIMLSMSPDLSPELLDLLTHLKSLTLLSVIGAIVIWLWRLLWPPYKPLIVEEQNDGVLELQPRLAPHPIYGLVGFVDVDGKTREVAINPLLWPSFRLGGIPNIVDTTQESLVPSSPTFILDSNNDPGCQVFLSNGKSIVGSGSRVKYNGATCLLTAAHVWNGRSENLYVIKRGKMIKVEPNWKIVRGASHDDLDFMLIDVPQAVWSELHVQAAPMLPLTRATQVSITGGDVSTKLIVSYGEAVIDPKRPHIIHHKCSTAPRWSGAPIMSKGSIVGVHLGTAKPEVNRGCNVALLLSCKQETYYEGFNYHELELEDMDETEMQYMTEYRDIATGDTVVLAPRGYSTRDLLEIEKSFKMPRWSAYEDETPEEFYDANRDVFQFMETDQEHLNCRRAGVAKHSPPSTTSPVTSGHLVELMKTVECLYARSDAQIASLTQQVTNLASEFKELSRSSPNCAASTGPKEDGKPNSTPSSSKPAASNPPKHQKPSPNQSTNSQSSTPGQGPTTASRRRNGRSKRSPPKSGRS